jgi:hypothetical protein
MYLPTSIGFQAALTTEDAPIGLQGLEAIIYEVHVKRLLVLAMHPLLLEFLAAFSRSTRSVVDKVRSKSQRPPKMCSIRR